MARWEYDKIDLNNVPTKCNELDLLNDAGKDGWELVAVTSNNMAYVKRQLDDVASTVEERLPARSARRKSASPVRET